MMIPPRRRNRESLEFLETDDRETRVLNPPPTENICRVVESETFVEDAIIFSDRREIGGRVVHAKAAIVEREREREKQETHTIGSVPEIFLRPQM